MDVPTLIRAIAVVVAAYLVGTASSALIDLAPGAVFADQAGYELERRQAAEALAVMHALRLRVVSLPGAPVGWLLAGLRLPAPVARRVLPLAIGGARGGKSPSLRLRLRGGGAGPTEARWLNGAVAVAGARLGVPTPVNACLATLVDEVAADPSRGASWRGNPPALRDAALAWPAVSHAGG